ncbi:unnamed protein product, partial [marine sediment metagenome]
MAKNTAVITAEIRAKDNASKKVKKAESSFSKLGSAIKVGLVAAAAAGVAAIAKLTASFNEAIIASSKQQDNLEALRAQLVKLGPETDRVT